MKKLFWIFLLVLFVLTGCDNEEEEEKNEYLAMKSNLLENKEYTSVEDISCDILVSIDRVDEENVSYSVVLSNPKENMNNIKAIVVHNYYTEDIFPSVGLFDDEGSLLVGDDGEIELDGSIETTDDIDTIDLELKVLIEYTDDEGKIKDIYYKTT